MALQPFDTGQAGRGRSNFQQGPFAKVQERRDPHEIPDAQSRREPGRPPRRHHVAGSCHIVAQDLP